ncbi:TetR/AcrR family transcriptional regulator [Desulfosarcina sp.]|jgi:AcrR family transcriptional regulator|uniref:TetR/AcrR family transcriptional regulator n=1 Tax=Desulfosarcina sp. TaxID=2027861 RepID=UPI0029B842F9|nr:TetR/AcrR family transcriptional regulator [Desulfosarcina sp.]MDX2452457.1 TetR/AcrR family transcriptional regulator [Desulfosarcina sp.]MDX2490234.1 TetR/AcrR family transcriptional regulator [Desulfosarcina sp.]
MFTPLKPEVYQRLEQAVLDIFSHSDFHKANIRDVANRAGVSFSTIYKHYGSKERLVFAFVDVWLGKLTERIYDHLQGIEDLKEKMRKVLWLQLDYYERNPGLARIIFMTLPMETWMADETFKQKKMINLYLEVMRNGQKEGQLNPHVRAGVLLDFMLGTVQRAFTMWISRGQQGRLTDQASMLFEMVWRAISNPGNDRN